MRKYYFFYGALLSVALVAFFSILFLIQKEKKVPKKEIRITVPAIIFEEEIISAQEEKEVEKVKVIISLVAPVDCKIGELVVLDASASEAVSFEWKVKPETPNFVIIENGKRAFFSSPRSGTFLFVIAGAKGDEVGCILHEIKVIGKPIPQDPFTTLVWSWLPEDNGPLHLEALSRSFRESTRAEDIETLIEMTSVANRAVLGEDLERFKPFLFAFSDYLQKNYQDKTLEEHKELWLKIAKALLC